MQRKFWNPASCAAVLLWAAGVAGFSQGRPAPPVAPVAPVPAAPVPPVPPPPAGEVEFEAIVANAQRQAAQEMSRAHAAQADAHKAMARIKGDLGWLSGGKASRVLVVPTGEPEAGRIAQLEEDLAIMGRIIEKAVDSKDRQPKALGIDVFTFAGPAGAQHLYVGGHGAIFTLAVKFPLAALPMPTQREPPEEENSTWEDARRDVFGGPERGPFGAFKELSMAARDQEDYKPEKVERLKETIIDSLKHASRIRGLAPDERVSVVVTSAGSGLFEARAVRHTFGSGSRSGGGYGTRSEEKRETVRADSVLTIQAAKADIDAFTKGNLDPDEFRKKVTVTSY